MADDLTTSYALHTLHLRQGVTYLDDPSDSYAVLKFDKLLMRCSVPGVAHSADREIRELLRRFLKFHHSTSSKKPSDLQHELD